MNWLKRLFAKTAAPAPLAPIAAERLEAWRSLPPVMLDGTHFHTRYIVVDVESSGLNMARDRLISIGAVAVSGGLISAGDAFETVLRQDEISTTENILIHGIGGGAQRAGLPPDEALTAFLAYLGNAPLVAYHAQFDQAMITRAMRAFLGLGFKHTWIDLAWIMPELYKERIEVQTGLDDWLYLFGIENIQRHNAVSDAYATARLLQTAIARAAALGFPSPRSLIEIENLRRWLRRG